MLNLVDDDGDAAKISLASSFFNPSFYNSRDIAEVLRGLAAQKAQEVDSLVINEARNFLMRAPNGPAFDLAALNIQRGLDHGVGDYNTVRSSYGLAEVESFADITSDSDVQQALTDAHGDELSNNAFVVADDGEAMSEVSTESGTTSGSTAGSVAHVAPRPRPRLSATFRRWSSSRRQSWSRAAAARCGRSARRRTLRGLMFTPQSGFVQPRLAGCRGDSAA